MSGRRSNFVFVFGEAGGGGGKKDEKESLFEESWGTEERS